MRCILSTKTVSPLGDTGNVEGNVSAIAKMIPPDSRALVNLNAVPAVGLFTGPLLFKRD